MNAPRTIETLAEAEAARDRLASEARAAGERADKLAAVAWQRREARHAEWATAVLADHVAEESRLARAEQDAERAFRVAAVEAADPREAYFSWMSARSAVNVQRDRITQARAALGAAQSDSGYVFHDQPVYSAELDSALSAEASARAGELAESLQLELNALDR